MVGLHITSEIQWHTMCGFFFCLGLIYVLVFEKLHISIRCWIFDGHHSLPRRTDYKNFQKNSQLNRTQSITPE